MLPKMATGLSCEWHTEFRNIVIARECAMGVLQKLPIVREFRGPIYIHICINNESAPIFQSYSVAQRHSETLIFEARFVGAPTHVPFRHIQVEAMRLALTSRATMRAETSALVNEQHIRHQHSQKKK